MLYDDSTAGQTFELYGPKQYSMGQIAEMVDKEIFKQRRHVNVPKAVLKPLAGILNKALWWHSMSADEVEREFIDQVINPEAKTFKDLGIEPGDIASFTYHYLVSEPRKSYLQQHVSNYGNSKDSAVRTTMTYLRQQRKRRGRIRSTSMSWMSCKMGCAFAV
jgi:NADH dehydrogenase (ubiquinone) 1 alpha subcomplex subunit 9